MALQDMFAAVNNSVPTVVVGGVTATATIVEVADASVLPAGPNVATLGDDDDAELVYYAALEGGALTGCVRGFNGTLAQIWPEGTAVYRAYTAVDHNRFKANIEDLDGRKLDADGDGSAVTAAFAQASARANVATGESAATLWGKVRRWFADLKDGAFAAFGTGSGDVARGDHGHGQYASKPDGVVPGHLYMADEDGNLSDSGIMNDLVVTTAQRVLELLKTVDGVGSGLDADLLDGYGGGYTGNYLMTSTRAAAATGANNEAPGLGLIRCDASGDTALGAAIGGVGTYAYVLTFYAASTAKSQFAWPYNSTAAAGRMARRTMYGGTWGAWAQLG